MARYHQSKSHESKRDHYRKMGKSGMYHTDSNMIHDDPTAACMLPTHIIEKEYGRGGSPLAGTIGSLYSGVQKLLHEDAREMRNITKPSKY